MPMTFEVSNTIKMIKTTFKITFQVNNYTVQELSDCLQKMPPNTIIENFNLIEDGLIVIKLSYSQPLP